MRRIIATLIAAGAAALALAAPAAATAAPAHPATQPMCYGNVIHLDNGIQGYIGTCVFAAGRWLVPWVKCSDGKYYYGQEIYILGTGRGSGEALCPMGTSLRMAGQYLY